MFSTVTNWFTGDKGDDKSPATEDDVKNSVTVSDEKDVIGDRDKISETHDDKSQKEISDASSGQSQEGEEGDFDFDEMSAKAISTAKDWGNYLYNFGKSATEQVAKTAKQLKDTVEEKTIIGDFSRQQDQFVSENKEKKKQAEAAVPPWVGYNEEEAMKKQILALSSDKRNFLRNPPKGVQFNFDYESSHPVAMAMLQEDSKLENMRFEIVPKQVPEDIFWRNYFYRVSLIKQSAQLTSLAQQTGSTGEITFARTDSSKSLESAPRDIVGKRGESQDTDELPTSSPTEHEFVSDTFQDDQISQEELLKEMQQLGMNEENKKDKLRSKPTKDEDIPEWERELQAELQEYEVVDDDNNIDDTDLEKEILQQIEGETDDK